ncbi:unnamed protein product [Closterium sp. NIES-53]
MHRSVSLFSRHSGLSPLSFAPLHAISCQLSSPILVNCLDFPPPPCTPQHSPPSSPPHPHLFSPLSSHLLSSPSTTGLCCSLPPSTSISQLGGNQLTGSIPASFSNLVNLQGLCVAPPPSAPPPSAPPPSAPPLSALPLCSSPIFLCFLSLIPPFTPFFRNR